MNDQTKAAMQMVYQALWVCREHNKLHFGEAHNTVIEADEAYNALHEALAQPQSGWVDLTDGELNGVWREFDDTSGFEYERAVIAKFKEKNTPQVITQPQGEWVDLDGDDIEAVLTEQPNGEHTNLHWFYNAAQSAIAKFKEKNTPPVVPQGKQQDVSQIEAMVNLHDAAFVRGFAAGKLYGQANPEPQEPVAWMLEQGDVVEFEYRDYHENSEWTPLYTAPPVVPQVVTEGNASEVRSTDTGEPVAWMNPNGGAVLRKFTCGLEKETYTIPLYTTPPSVEAAIEATKEKAAKVCEDFQDKPCGMLMADILRSMK